MLSRPQFSLRTLLVVTVMVCLAAATVSELPDDQVLERHAQTALSVALCIIFPAMFLAAAVVTRGYARTVWTGGLFPALAPLAMACMVADAWVASDEWLMTTWTTMSELRRVCAVMWAIIPCSSLACLFVHWLLQLGSGRHETPTKPAHLALRRAIFAVAALSVWAGALFLPDQFPSNLAQGLLSIALNTVVPALFAVGAVYSRNYLRTVCIGAFIPAAVGMTLMCWAAVYNTTFTVSSPDLATQLVGVGRPPAWMLALSVSVPLFGLTCVFFHWLFQSSESNENTE